MKQIGRTEDGRPSFGRRFLSFPLTYMGVGAVFVFLPAAILGGIGSELGTAGTIVSALIGAAAGLLFYKLTMMLIARR